MIFAKFSISLSLCHSVVSGCPSSDFMFFMLGVLYIKLEIIVRPYFFFYGKIFNFNQRKHTDHTYVSNFDVNVLVQSSIICHVMPFSLLFRIFLSLALQSFFHRLLPLSLNLFPGANCLRCLYFRTRRLVNLSSLSWNNAVSGNISGELWILLTALPLAPDLMPSSLLLNLLKDEFRLVFAGLVTS